MNFKEELKRINTQIKTPTKLKEEVVSRKRNIKKVIPKFATCLLVMIVIVAVGVFMVKYPVFEQKEKETIIYTKSYGTVMTKIAGPSLEKSHSSTDISKKLIDALIYFTVSSSKEIMKEDGENKLYAPASLFTNLAMLANMSEGKTRKEILNLLEVKDVNELELFSDYLQEKVAFKSEDNTFQTANSAWLNKNIPFNEELLHDLSDDYNMTAYQGDFTTKEMKKEVINWVNENTGNRLGDGFQNLELDDATALLLFNTIYFKDAWDTELIPDKEKQPFYLTDGTTVHCNYMSKKMTDRELLELDDMMVSGYEFKNGAEMIFIKPMGNHSVYDIFKDKNLLMRSLNYKSDSDVKTVELIYQVPKFSYQVSMDLVEDLKQLGVKRVFDVEKAELTRLTDLDDIYVNLVRQDTFIDVSEKECEASAVTLTEIVCNAASNNFPIEFTLDQPFIYMIVKDNIPLFLGVVENPTK